MATTYDHPTLDRFGPMIASTTQWFLKHRSEWLDYNDTWQHLALTVLHCAGDLRTPGLGNWNRLSAWDAEGNGERYMLRALRMGMRRELHNRRTKAERDLLVDPTSPTDPTSEDTDNEFRQFFERESPEHGFDQVELEMAFPILCAELKDGREATRNRMGRAKFYAGRDAEVRQLAEAYGLSLDGYEPIAPSQWAPRTPEQRAREAARIRQLRAARTPEERAARRRKSDEKWNAKRRAAAAQAGEGQSLSAA